LFPPERESSGGVARELRKQVPKSADPLAVAPLLDFIRIKAFSGISDRDPVHDRAA